MASLLPARAARTISCSACRTFAPPVAAPLALPLLRRNYSTPAEEPEEIDHTNKPRWSYTPPRTKAPFSLHMHSNRPAYPINEDPKRLDEFYLNFLGAGGDKVLSDEVKWLAVTHKSFDQGRRGFNDRLAFLGKRIVQLQASIALAQSPPNTFGSTPIDPISRKPFSHASLSGIDNLSANNKQFLTNKVRIAGVAEAYGLLKILRWWPRTPDNLKRSGVDLVLAHTMYAIIGALALEKGGQYANQMARLKILGPLGINVQGP